MADISATNPCLQLFDEALVPPGILDGVINQVEEKIIVSMVDYECQ